MSWDNYWDEMSRMRPVYSVVQSFHWRNYAALLKGLELKHPRFLEIGAGSGMLSMKMLERYGGDVTLVDKSPSAKNSCTLCDDRINYVVEDAFNLKFNDEFDLVFSDGVIEHFPDVRQRELVAVHADASKRYVIMFAPKPSLHYNLGRKAITASGRWFFGYEKPMTMKELVNLCEESDLRVLRTRSGGWQNGVLAEKRKA